MNRRVLAAAVAAATALVVVPAMPALAAASSTATLTAGQAVYPGADRMFTIRVTNTEAPVVGKAINAVRINFPVNEANIGLGSTPGSAPGFTGTSTDLGTTEFNTYRGGSIPPGAFLDFSFPALVGSPQARDLLGDFRVQVSSDNFASSRTTTVPAGGTLVSKVQILELVTGGIKPIAPTNAENTKGVTDRSGTAGQAITYETEIRSYAKQAVTVAAGLTTVDGVDKATPASVLVPAGGTAKAAIPVQLGAAAADRSTVFTATATKDGAAAPTKTDTFKVQAPATLSLGNLQPTRTRTGTGSARDFTANASKTGTQAVDLTSSTLTFGTNSAKAEPVATFASGSNQKLLTYRFVSDLSGTGQLSASAVTAAADDNLADYVFNADLGLITIDNLAPDLAVAVKLPTDRDGDQQVASKNGDTISVSGTIKNAGDLVANSLSVVLQPNKGNPITVPVTLSGSGEERTFSGSRDGVQWGESTTFFAKAEAKDTVGNLGGAQSPITQIDNLIPSLAGDGVITRADMITVQFTDATGVDGGCDARSWLLDGTPNRVKEVRRANGEACTGLDDGARVLILNSALAVDATPRVTYEQLVRPVSASLAKDGAGNDAIRQTINTVTRLTPAAPRLVTLERQDGSAYEAAFLDEDDKKYYSNATGDGALRLTVGGIQQNYTVQVLRNGIEVVKQKFTAAPSPLASDYNGSVVIPVPATLTDGDQAYTVRFLSAQSLAGDPTAFTVNLDRVRPAFSSSQPTLGVNGSEVTVDFTEKLAKGSDFADDWFVSETVDTENGTARRTVNVESVRGVDQDTRILSFTLNDPSKYAGADYYLQSGNGVRYEDRAGNMLKNTLGPAS